MKFTLADVSTILWVSLEHIVDLYMLLDLNLRLPVFSSAITCPVLFETLTSRCTHFLWIICRDVMSSQGVVDFVSQRLPTVSTLIIGPLKFLHLSCDILVPVQLCLVLVYAL